MKTLYLSDLDGTLLRRDQTLSDFTIRTISSLVERGMVFSYATARSVVTASKVTQGLRLEVPVIVHNGAFIRHPGTGAVVQGFYLGEEGNRVLEDLIGNGIYPLVYSMNDGQEKFRYVPQKLTSGMGRFLGTRENDPRALPVEDVGALRHGEPYYITCVDEPEKLRYFYEKYRDSLHCILYTEIYSGELFLELMPKAASKANAALQLKTLLGCDRLVVFGDGKNDLDLFRAADECYAVSNAEEEVKALATAVIGNDQEDGVARWLLEHVEI